LEREHFNKEEEMREEHANEINKIRRKLEESEKARAALKDDI